ncbi:MULTISPECIES: hypothetical protein [unclassified Coleofasciculus]|uniref:hypothetical protein n=1 Tax=Cyanophyceae TaxID=3028117 RepID=UPI001689AB46|nr:MULTISPECIES: hypothetical protein [unclassified Coleofasciculus]MBD1895054.1 hypothetical protein [Coleofasciculus sp. FACHB-129]
MQYFGTSNQSVLTKDTDGFVAMFLGGNLVKLAATKVFTGKIIECDRADVYEKAEK